MPSIRYNFIYNALLNISRVIFPLITAPYVSRILEPDGVGLFNFANTYAGYFALFAVLGIPTYGIREVAKIHDDKEKLSTLVSELLSLSLFTTLGITMIYLSSLLLIKQLYENHIIFFISGFLLYFAPLRIDWFFSGLEQFKYITIRTIIIRSLSIIALFLFVHTKSDLIIYVILNVFGIIGGDIWNFIKLQHLGIKPRIVLSGLKKHLSPLFVLFSASIAVSIYAVLDTLMLGFMTDYREVGFYNNAIHISKTLLAIITGLSLVAIPRMSQYFESRDYDKISDLANKSFSLVVFLAVPLTLGIICIAPTFVPLFYGQEFYGVILPLIILSFLVIAIGLNNVFGVQTLIPMNLDNLFLYSILGGSISNFTLNLVLIPLWGSVGAAISSIIAESVVAVLMAIFIYQQTPVRFTRSYMNALKSIAGALLFIPLIWLLHKWVDGWMLVIEFFFCGSIVYCLSQKIFGNTTVDLLQPIIMQKIRSNV